tara:strand:- start:273 stop:1349 length:1077 start_codon:yes stop_codon:yes gene_type:complete
LNNRIKLKLGSRIIAFDSKPYIIAEIGVNHEGSLDIAKKLIDLAKEGGADAAKFQSYKADTLASKKSPFYWDISKEPTRSQHELFKKYDQFEPKDYIALYEHCKSTGIDFLSTPFDDNAIEFLNPIIPFYKVASADLTNIPFLRKVASKRKPLILSTGASTLSEIELAVNTINQSGCENIVLLHCILNYPTPFEMANLRMIKGLKKVFPNLLIGYSDHTLPDQSMTSLVTAHLLGAVVIEKHFTHDKNLPGNDHYHAMDVGDLKRFTSLIDSIHISLGKSDFKSPIETENVSRLNARRSVVIKKNITKGETLNDNNLTYKRPGTGISPLHWDNIIGSISTKDLEEDDLLSWGDFETKK